LNNPLKYTDPTGYKTWFGHFFGWVGEKVGAGFKALGDVAIYAINLPSSIIDAVVHFDLSRLDPTYSGTISNNALKIRDGLFEGTPMQIASRFYGEGPQTNLGIAYSELSNLFGTVKSVNYYDGATVVQNYKDHVWMGPGLGVTLGSYINGSNSIAAHPNNSLFQHEYGHYLQSQVSGLAYLPLYGLPSLTGDGNHSHDFNPVEQDANVRAFDYFNRTAGGFYDKVPFGDKHGWDFYYNPIDPNHTYSTWGTYWDYKNPNVMDVVNTLILYPTFFPLNY